MAILVVVVAIFGIWLFEHNKNHGGADKWATFESQKYGFEFNYPNEWKQYGNPTVSEYEQGAVKDYIVNFYTNGPIKDNNYYTVSIVLQSKEGQDALTKNKIKTRLAQAKNGLLAYNESSYSQLEFNKQANLDVLNIYQIVNLPNLNVDAAQGTYLVGNSSDCPTDKLSTDDNSRCIKQANYNDLGGILKSLHQSSITKD